MRYVALSLVLIALAGCDDYPEWEPGTNTEGRCKQLYRFLHTYGSSSTHMVVARGFREAEILKCIEWVRHETR